MRIEVEIKKVLHLDSEFSNFIFTKVPLSIKSEVEDAKNEIVKSSALIYC